MSEGLGFPLLVCDVWEHAYYLDYQNLRADYIGECLNFARSVRYSSFIFFVSASPRPIFLSSPCLWRVGGRVLPPQGPSGWRTFDLKSQSWASASLRRPQTDSEVQYAYHHRSPAASICIDPPYLGLLSSPAALCAFARRGVVGAGELGVRRVRVRTRSQQIQQEERGVGLIGLGCRSRSRRLWCAWRQRGGSKSGRPWCDDSRPD